jgi:hypothetical protein|tara:strand:- start:8983 stop:9276 length:294 start_codon:yes stop_codon:yes gene_type:complete
VTPYLHHGVPERLRAVVIPHPDVIGAVLRQTVRHTEVKKRSRDDFLIPETHVVHGEGVENLGVRVHEQRQPQRAPRFFFIKNHLAAFVRVPKLGGVA